MDLKEASLQKKQWRDVWVLEDEAFKEPITFQIEYTDHDRELIEASKQEVQKQVTELQRVAWRIDGKEEERKQLISSYKEELKVKDQKIEELTKRLEKAWKEKVQLVKEANKIKEQVENHNEQLTTLKEILSEIKKKITKEPRVFSGQTFLSWNWSSALSVINVPDGNYIVSEVCKIVEKNEYVENEDMEVKAYNLHVSDNTYIPEYELIGTTWLDTPTATIERTFTLLPY